MSFPSSAPVAFSSSAVACIRLATRVCADVPLESETPSTDSSLSAAPWAVAVGCWIPAIAATSDCDRNPNEAEEELELSSLAAFPLPLPVSAVSDETVAVAVAVAVALSWASACDWARVCKKLGPVFLLGCVAPLLPFEALLADCV